MASRADLKIAFDGPAVADGRMDVRDLAPALLALGELVDASNVALNGDAASVRIEVRATAHACFEIDFEIVTSVTKQMVTLFSGDAITAAIQFKELIFGGGVGLWWLLKKTGGRRPERVERLDDSTFRLTVDGESYIVPLKLLRLYQDYGVRRAAERAVYLPLQSQGITSIRVGDRGRPELELTKADAPAFVAPEMQEETLLDESREVVLSIISPVFKEENKWRLFDGSNQISAAIEDQAFLLAVNDSAVRFGKGDLLRCLVRVRQIRAREGLKIEYTVERVLEHIPATRQIELPFRSADEPT